MKPLLEFQTERTAPSAPRPAATVVLLRDGDGGVEPGPAGALQVFCVERSGKSSFLAGALVFPGGQLDPGDREWALHVPVQAGRIRAWDREDLRAEAFALAAVRETLEEAGILLAEGATGVDAIRAALLGGASLRDLLKSAGLTPALHQLHPFARWITPAAEKKRFDTTFFLARSPVDQLGAHDDTETVSSLWATPHQLLARWEVGAIALVPPTHATLEWLATCTSVEDALRRASSLSLRPICPELAQHEGAVALLLPGDPEHTVRELSHPHAPRYVLRNERFVPQR